MKIKKTITNLQYKCPNCESFDSKVKQFNTFDKHTCNHCKCIWEAEVK